MTTARPDAVPAATPSRPAAATLETVLAVTHHTDRVFTFSLTRPAGFRFASGEFVMLGMEIAGRPLMRAYSIASPAWAETLDFHSIKVPDGPLTARLQRIRPGDRILLGRKPTGTLVVDALTPAERLYLLATGTGVAPFASLLREPALYDRFRRVVLVQGCRRAADLAYADAVAAAVVDDPLVGEAARAAFTYVPSLTQEDHPMRGRIPDLIATGRLARRLDAPPLSPDADRVMICGSPGLLTTLRTMLDGRGFREGTASVPGDYAIERAFVA